MNTIIYVQERKPAPLSADVFNAVPNEFWRAADCTVAWSTVDSEWTVSAGDTVGISRLATPTGNVTISITSKFADADIFYLADYAFGQQHEALRLLDFDSVTVDAVKSDATACLLLWHVGAVKRFASRWLGRDYRSRTQVLDGSIRGKVMIGSYVKKHLAAGEASRIPCRIIERTQDTPNNRILKAGLRYIANLAHSLPVAGARQAILHQVNATLPRFAQVSEIKPTPADIRSISAKGAQRHYGPILRSTLDLLGHRFITDRAGDHEIRSFMWQMPILFQESVRGLVSAIDGLVLDATRTARASILDSDGNRLRTARVDPDLVIRDSSGQTLILDTKYKHALPQATATGEELIAFTGNERVKIVRSDIYQAVAYRQHDAWDNAETGLVYPVCLPHEEPTPKPMRIHGFGKPVVLLFMDIGPHARKNNHAFCSQLRQLVADGDR
ncbi:5-methylcytosine restriction system specificity protein McrC [Nocardia cyriacigeorgica]|uniref:5-methylcytosine restriction system specificity protein McrC n=1 Tax=Nocardia cyriacigeorgica TaxID=135487 RepID=UPI0024576E8A|nr:hypothetical protein [Nocardia cyriacigeorgica]